MTCCCADRVFCLFGVCDFSGVVMTFSSIPQSLRMQLIIALGATTLVFMSILTLLSYRTAGHTHEKLAL